MGKLQDTLKEKYEAVKKTVKEGWDTVVTFVEDHKETLKAVATGVIAVGLIVGGIALTTVTLGAATPLIVCIGSGLAMAGVGVGMEQVQDYKDDGHFNRSFKEYLSSAASGFVMGFTAPIAGGAATAGMKVLGAGLSMAGGSVVGQSIETGTVSFKQTLTDGLLGAAFGAVGEGLASSGILGKAFNFGKKKILGLVDDFLPKGPAMAEAGTGMKMSVNAADDIGKFELGKIEQTAVQKNYNAVMNPSKAIASTTDDVAEQVLVKSADDVAGRMAASSADDVAVGAVAGSRQAGNVQLSTQGQSSITQELSKAADPYAGVKQASEYLKSQGVPRKFRKQVLESFDVRTIEMDVARSNTYGLRFYDDINASAKGRFLFETFDPLTNRNNLALLPEWNSMAKIQQFQVKQGTTMIRGKAAPQSNFGNQYEGGATQWYINNLNNLIP